MPWHKAQRTVDGPAHGAAEGDPLHQLLGDALGHKLRVQFGLVDLLDLQIDVAPVRTCRSFLSFSISAPFLPR